MSESLREQPQTSERADPRPVTDALQRALWALNTPTSWHWRLYHDIKSCLDRAEREGL